MPALSQKSQVADGIQAVSLAFQIVERLAYSGKSQRVTDLARALGTSKPRIYRHLKTLVKLGYVSQELESERYRVTVRLARVGSAVANQFDFLDVAHPVMLRIRDAVGQAVVLAREDQGAMVVVTSISGRSAIKVGLLAGIKLASHATAQGKILLAFGPPSLLEAAIKKGLTARTARTIADPAQFRREIARIRRQRWAVAPEESTRGINGIAAPIMSGDRLFGTLALVGSIDEIPAKPSPRLIKALLAGAQEISANTFHSPH